MSSDRKRRERQFEALLASYDDALAAGGGEAFEADLPTDLVQRLREAQKCVDHLHAMWGTACPAGENGAPPAHSAASEGGVTGIEGETIGRFRIERELGHGGAGIVFLATDPKLNRHVALKVPRPEGLISRELRQ